MKPTLFLLSIAMLWLHPSVNNLTSNTWSLVKIKNLNTKEVQYSNPDCIINLAFDQTGDYHGFNSGNNYRGSYFATSENKLVMNSPGRTKHGDDPSCKLGQMLYDYFPKANAFVIYGDTLVLFAEDNIEISFRKN
jgi:heat shock protein HslJ